MERLSHSNNRDGQTYAYQLDPPLPKAPFLSRGLRDNEPLLSHSGSAPSLEPSHSLCSPSYACMRTHTHTLLRGRRSGRQSPRACLDVGRRKMGRQSTEGGKNRRLSGSWVPSPPNQNVFSASSRGQQPPLGAGVTRSSSRGDQLERRPLCSSQNLLAGTGLGIWDSTASPRPLQWPRVSPQRCWPDP